jgi:hypothetical protein
MPEEKAPSPSIVLGEFELIGKNRSEDLIELVFRPSFPISGLAPMRFDKGGRSSITINDKKLAKTLNDEDRFRIVLERIP